MSKIDYISNYNKQSYYSILLRIPKKNKDYIEHIESQPSKNGYIIDLISEDIHPSILKISFIKTVLKDTLIKHGIKNIYLFGSYARGDAKADSDVDILCDKGDISTLIQKSLLEEELESKLNKKVDLIFTTSDMPEYFQKTIEKDLIQLC